MEGARGTRRTLALGLLCLGIGHLLVARSVRALAKSLKLVDELTVAEFVERANALRDQQDRAWRDPETQEAVAQYKRQKRGV